MKIEDEQKYIENWIATKLSSKDVPIRFESCFCVDNDYVLASDSNRKDLTDKVCITIDGPDTNDLDDAVSLMVTDQGYELGVHIVDVAAYIPDGSDLSKEVAERGTSIYFPGYSVPMFPEDISRDICSLLPNVDKRTISVIVNLDFEGNIQNYDVYRSFIRSRVRGVYSEVEAILDNTAEDMISAKYRTVADEIKKMYKLSGLLRRNRAQNGANIGCFSESKYLFDNGKLVLSVRGDTKADRIIREFMIVANSCMSDYFEARNLPGMYRTQGRVDFTAKYSTVAEGHESMLLRCGYLRFTSPLRRASDYKMNQILALYLDGATSDSLNDMYLEELAAYCTLAQRLEDRSKSLEKAVIEECNFLYFSRHPDDTYRGVVIGKARSTAESIVTIQPYGIRIIGSSMLTKYVGQEFMIRVSVDKKDNCLRVGHISRCIAA